MVEFTVDRKKIELVSYSPDATLRELSSALEQFRLTSRLKTMTCKGCGECCSDNIPVLGLDLIVLQQGLHVDFEELAERYLLLPERPDIKARRKAIREQERSGGDDHLTATLLFEYNNAEPVILSKKPEGECTFLENNLCAQYVIRPYSCGLYLCNMGEKLSFLQEMIIRQGTWHAYYLMGWIGREDVLHNPFLKADSSDMLTDSYDKLLVKDFDFDLGSALDQLFFYF